LAPVKLPQTQNCGSHSGFCKKLFHAPKFLNGHANTAMAHANSKLWEPK